MCFALRALFFSLRPWPIPGLTYCDHLQSFDPFGLEAGRRASLSTFGDDLAVADAHRVAIAPDGRARLFDDLTAAVFHTHGDPVVGDRAGTLFRLIAGKAAKHGTADARQLLARAFSHLVAEHTAEDGAPYRTNP